MDSKVDLMITSRERDIGGFHVRRLLPYATRRTVGPFVFFDHMGPAHFQPGEGMDVRPHPHIGLATVTYLFEGVIHHRDSLGSDQLIEPGAINWMTAGRGIVHSERTPPEIRKTGAKLSGIQVWVALPTEHEDTTPDFSHFPSRSLPEFSIDQVQLKLLVGSAYGKRSPVPAHSNLFYLDVRMPKGARLTLPAEGRESGFYLVEGELQTEQKKVIAQTMVVAKNAEALEIEATEASRLMVFGGESVGKRYLWWNLVSSSEEKIEAAKKEWLPGPRAESLLFQPIPNDQDEFIPLPEGPAQSSTTEASQARDPKGTIM